MRFNELFPLHLRKESSRQRWSDIVTAALPDFAAVEIPRLSVCERFMDIPRLLPSDTRLLCFFQGGIPAVHKCCADNRNQGSKKEKRNENLDFPGLQIQLVGQHNNQSAKPQPTAWSRQIPIAASPNPGLLVTRSFLHPHDHAL